MAKRALCAGINDYPGTDSDLEGCVNDSHDFLPPSVYLPRREVAKLLVRRALRPSSPPGRYAALLMAGCQDTEYSFDAYFKGRPNGAFTFVALQALAKLPAGATYYDWYKKIRSMLPSRQYPQIPNLYDSTSMKRWKVFG